MRAIIESAEEWGRGGGLSWTLVGGLVGEDASARRSSAMSPVDRRRNSGTPGPRTVPSSRGILGGRGRRCRRTRGYSAAHRTGRRVSTAPPSTATARFLLPASREPRAAPSTVFRTAPLPRTKRVEPPLAAALSPLSSETHGPLPRGPKWRRKHSCSAGILPLGPNMASEKKKRQPWRGPNFATLPPHQECYSQ